MPRDARTGKLRQVDQHVAKHVVTKVGGKLSKRPCVLLDMS